MKHQWPNKKWILGHRGARAIAPENTLSAFRIAMECGADGIELDVFLSKDGIPVVIHDEKVDRTTDGNGKVCDLTAHKLWKLNAAKKFSKFKKEGVPALEQVFDMMVPGSIVNVELKGSGYFSKQEFVNILLVLFQKYEDKLCLIISSFDAGLLALFRKTAPKYLISLLLSSRDKNFETAFQYLESIKPDALHLPPLLARPLVRSLVKYSQMKSAIWTVNEPFLAKKWFKKGVDGIFTDNVPEVVKALTSS